MGEIQSALKKSVSILERAGVPCVLGGGAACWARGAPEATDDVDLMVRREDAGRALEALAEAGMRTERPPEQWLYKARCDDVLIDLIFEPVGRDVDDELFARSERLNIDGMNVQVMAMEDVMITKLLALDEHTLDLRPALAIARALREQVDWNEVGRQTAGSPFARAFLFLLEELGVIAPTAPVPRAATKVRAA